MSNAGAAESEEGFATARDEVRFGRVIGYFVDYGNDLTSEAPVSEIDSGVTEWRSPADARLALGWLTRWQLKAVGRSRFGVQTTVTKTGGVALGVEHAAVITTTRVGPGKTVYCVGERVVEGGYIVAAEACGASRAAAQRLAPILIRRIDERLHAALAGRLRGKPVRPPLYRKPGPPAQRPQPAAFVLRPGDLPAKRRHAEYEQTGFRSEYVLSLFHAGPYAYLHQAVALNINSALAQFWGAEFLYQDLHTGTYTGAIAPIHARSISLSSVPDHAQGQIVRVSLSKGRVDYDSHIVLRHGPWLEFITAVRSSPPSIAGLCKLARLAASRLDNGLGG